MPPNSIDPVFRRKLAALLAFVIALILYGSLYPWEFEVMPGLNPVLHLLHSWDSEMNRFVLRDIGINVLLYMPVGFVGWLLFRRMPVAVAIGFALSCAVEMIQSYEPARQTSLVDVTTNTIGTVLGVIGARMFEGVVGTVGARLAARRKRDASALMLLAVLAAWLLFPFFPVPGRAAMMEKLRAMATEHSPFDPALLLPAIAIWYAAGLMIRAAGMRRKWLWAGLSLAPLGAELLIVHLVPWPATIIGAALGAVLAVFPPVAVAGAIAVILMTVMRGLAPFHFAGTPQPFLWIPFEGFLSMDWETGVSVLLQKVFFYGAAIWLLREAGLRLGWTAVLVATMLGAIEAVQVYIPAHTPEITDPLLALLLAFGIGALSPVRARTVSRMRASPSRGTGTRSQ